MFDVKLKGLPNEDLLQGFPGIPGSWPRVVGTIEIRTLPKQSREGKSLPITHVVVGLYRTDVIVPPGNKPSINNTKKEQSFLVTRQKELYNNSSQLSNVYALDLPFTLSLPTNRPIPGTITLGKSIETKYHVYVSISSFQTGKHITEYAKFEVRVLRYDTLPLFARSQGVVNQYLRSPDHLIESHFSLLSTIYGPSDTIVINVFLEANKDWKRARKVWLKRLSAELVQVIKYFTEDESGAAEKRSRLDKCVHEYSDVSIEALDNPLSLQLSVPDCVPKGGLDSAHTKSLFGFSTATPSYKIEALVKVKACFGHAKDIEVELPVVLSQFGLLECSKLTKYIVEAAKAARTANGERREMVVYDYPLAPAIEIV